MDKFPVKNQFWRYLAVSLALHAALLFGLGRSEWFAAPTMLATLSVKLLAPPRVTSPPPAAPVVDAPPRKQLAKPQTTPISKPPKRLHTKPAAKPQPSVDVVTPSQTPAARAQAADAPSTAQQPDVHAVVSVPADTGATAMALPVAITTATTKSLPNTAPHEPFQGVPVGSAADAPTHASQPPTPPVPWVTDLALVCPDKSPADYPLLSRRLNESGTVVLQVEVDQHGAVATASVEHSSGFSRLDAAALAAVRLWHCRAPTRNGHPVRVTARQPFHFKLED